MKIAVGLGNPGAKYVGTRHNVGFEVLNYLSSQQAAPPLRAKYEGQLTSLTVDDTTLLLVWPLTYMNESGRCVKAVANFYKVDVRRDLLVVCDDLSLPLGKLRMRGRGSAGGQKGLNHILQTCGTQEIARLRIGIDPTPPRWDAADYVLGRFREDEQPVIQEAVQRAAQGLLDWCRHDVAHCMNHINTRVNN
ncbi:MAG: aminoacyl-tRNA hydrolase [Planctomycetales bacterium]|nr:aminoacyl-tRNA hydrolase [Planctomycetales bacterium]